MGPVLVAGGSGLPGAPVVRELVTSGYDVRLLSRNPANATGTLGPLARSVEVVPRTVTDRDSVDRAVRGCSHVHISLDGGPDRAELEAVEHQGTALVAAAARSGRRTAQLRVRHARPAGLRREDPGARSQARRGTRDPRQRRPPSAAAHLRRGDPDPARSGTPRGGHRTTTPAAHGRRRGPRPHGRARLRPSGRRRPRPAHTRTRTGDDRRCATRLLRTGGPAQPRGDHPPRALSRVDRLLSHGRLRPALHDISLLERCGEHGDPTEADQLLGAPTTTVDQWSRRVAEADGL